MSGPDDLGGKSKGVEWLGGEWKQKKTTNGRGGPKYNITLRLGPVSGNNLHLCHKMGRIASVWEEKKIVPCTQDVSWGSREVQVRKGKWREKNVLY